MRVMATAPRPLWRAVASEAPEALPEHGPEWLDAMVDDRAVHVDASRLYEFRDGRRFVLPLVRQSRTCPGRAAGSASYPTGVGYRWPRSARTSMPPRRSGGTGTTFARCRAARIVRSAGSAQRPSVWAEAAQGIEPRHGAAPGTRHRPDGGPANRPRNASHQFDPPRASRVAETQGRHGSRSDRARSTASDLLRALPAVG